MNRGSRVEWERRILGHGERASNYSGHGERAKSVLNVIILGIRNFHSFHLILIPPPSFFFFLFLPSFLFLSFSRPP